ncbi:YciI family protein [Kitasatospora sp. RB6PN24]|uniref:YciI family protein n=1 Tax=Kitasatospora humi TaxID=2893891 RepID=UPI001E590938|nr:YciI family protein [Kitasatospora humi]MCC9311854.1 YciI family protein [Kitasatospora humi]
MFILLLTYLKNLAEIDALLPDHWNYLERNYREGTFLLSGRQVPRTGGVILAAGDDVEAIRKITQTDPFVRAGAARYDIVQMTPTAASGTLSASLAASGLQGITTIQPTT